MPVQRSSHRVLVIRGIIRLKRDADALIFQSAGEKVPVGSALTLMVGNGAGNMLEDDATDTSMDTEEPVASDASPAQEDSWF